MRAALLGTGELVRLALRRDRFMLPSWVLALVITLYGSVASTAALYPTEQARQETSAVIADNPAVIALYGPATDLHTLGGLATWKPNTIMAVLIALLSAILVVRHTRADEETGRLELVGAGVVGRHAALTAALVVAVGTNLLLVVLMAASLAGQDLSFGAVLLLTAGYGAVGLMFTGLAAVAAQLTESARTATGISTAVLVVAFLLRAAGDSAAGTSTATELSWLSWVSPIGWVEKTRPFGDPDWSPLVLALAFAVLAMAAGYRLAASRDLAAGLLPARLGPARASRSLSSPLALAWRLQRGALLGWAVGFAVVGWVLGSLASSAGKALDGSAVGDFIASIGGGGGNVLVDTYLAASLGIAAVVATAYAVQSTLRLRAEELSQRIEPLLATRVDRLRWAAGHLTIAALGSTALMAVVGVVAGLAHGAQVGEVGAQLPRVLAAALVQVPAIWVVAGICVVAFGLAPRLASAGWGALVAFLLIGELGPVLKVDQWVLDLSPYSHVPRLPAAHLAVLPLLVLLLVAAALTAAGLAGFRRRDLG